MVISSVIFIATFTFIQINNQMESINRYNKFEANLSGAILKNNIEAIIRQVEPAEIPTHIQSILNEFKNSKLIRETTIFNPEGKIVASSDNNLNGENVSYRDLDKLNALNNAAENKTFIADIDRSKQALNIFIGLKLDPQEPIAYVAKSTFNFSSPQEALAAVYYPIIIAVIIVILANIIFGYLLSKTVLGPIKILNKVTKIIAEGDLTIRTHIQTNDELQELGSTFNYMTEQLVKMKERAENANPLTKLPGNIVIHEEIEKRIQGNQKFVVIYCDLDNFKAFNDKYGIGKGDEAIKLTAEIFKAASKNKGAPEDFIGHEGGDDFILLTTPDKAQAIADNITQEFDKNVRSLYSQEDLKQGYIIAHARDNSVKQFPIMTISLAGVSNASREIASYAEVTNIAAEIKKKAKAIEGSVFVMDQRKSS